MEPLVATLLVTLALLGVAALQLASLRDGARMLEMLAAHGLVAGHADVIRALHGAPAEARAAIGSPGAALGCRAERRCTPAEFAADEAARWSQAGTALRWRTAPPRVDLSASPARFELAVASGPGPLLELGVES